LDPPSAWGVGIVVASLFIGVALPLHKHFGYGNEARAAPTQCRFAAVEYDGNGSAIVLSAVDSASTRP
jgi:hypothetical protein